MEYVINYDLCKPGQNYEKLISAITSYPGYCKLSQSSWVVSSSKAPREIVKFLKQYLDKNDIIFVGKLSGEAAWFGEPEKISNWLHTNL